MQSNEENSITLASSSHPGKSHLIIVVSSVGVLIFGLVLHFTLFGPAQVVQTYLTKVGDFDGAGAKAQVCANDRSAVQKAYNELRHGNESIDFSAITYSVVNVGLLSAHVQTSGIATLRINGKVNRQLSINTTFPIAISGVGWCIDTSDLYILELQGAKPIALRG